MKRILIVEDDPRIQTFYKDILKNEYQITGIVNNGPEAILMADEQNPDLIIMDIQLVGEMDGIETAKIILKNHNVPLLFISSLNDADVLHRARMAKPFGYLIKPVEYDVLLANIGIAFNVYSYIGKNSDTTIDHPYAERENTPESRYEQLKSDEGALGENVFVKASDDARRIEIVNNRFLKQYWVLDE